METKKCIKCEIEKSITEFSKHVKYKSGIRNSCKTCESQVKKQWKIDNPDKVKEERKRRKQKNLKRLNRGGLYWKKIRLKRLMNMVLIIVFVVDVIW